MKIAASAKQVFYRLADDNVTVCAKGIEAMFGGDAGAA
jgi:hypothetical protein